MCDMQEIVNNIHGFVGTVEEPVICFDFFDTLVTRRVMPEYTKKIAAEQLSNLLQNKISGIDLYEKRHNLESKLCAENLSAGEDQEFHLGELAKYLYDYLLDKEILNTAFVRKDDFIKIVLSIELAVEKQVQQPCEDMLSILKWLKAKQVKTLLISDFYLPATEFAELLSHHGLNKYFDNIFISCDYLRTKGSGRLYDLIVKNQKIDKKRMLMIGDNPHADQNMAEQVGIKSLLLDRKSYQVRYKQWEVKQLKPFNIQHVLLETIRSEKLEQFPEMSLTLWYFTKKLFDQLRHEHINDVFFLSREGEFLKKLFDSYQKQFFGQQIICSHYLLASRKSTYIASLAPIEDEEFAKLFSQYKEISPRDFLLSLNFTEVQSQHICDGININFTTRLHDFSQSVEYKTLRKSPLFLELYERIRVGQRENFKSYIRSFGVDLSTDGLYLVDVGWKGSMQDNISSILGKHIKISGYYIGLLGGENLSPSLKKKGILFSDLSTQEQFFPVYNNNRSLFEIMLGASHGSAEGYFLSHDEVNKRDCGCFYGKYADIHVAVSEAPEEAELYSNVIEPVQKCLENSFYLIGKSFLCNFQQIPPVDWFAAQHARMVFLPKKTEVDFFESLYHLENFGVFEFTTFNAGEKLSVIQKIFNLKAVVTDPLLLEIGFWPPVILCHLGIGPYRIVDGWKRYKRIFGLRRLWCALLSF